MSNPVFDLIGKSYNDVKETRVNVSSSNEVIILENEDFEYNIVDENVAKYLQNKEIEIKNIFAHAYTDLGRILFEAQEKLSGSNQYDGVFYKWFSSLGFKKDKVYSLISRYKLLIGNSDKQNLIEKLPLSLSYEISKESCPLELKELVLTGKIKSLKEFKEEKLNLENNDKLENAEIIISEADLEKEISNLELIYSNFAKNYKIKINKLDEKKKNELYKEIKNIEKKVEKIIKSID